MLFSLKRTPGKVLVDLVLFAAAWALAFQLRFGGDLPPVYRGLFVRYFAVALLVKLVVFTLTGTYKTVWRYSSLSDLFLLTRATLISWVALVVIIFALAQDSGFARGVAIIDSVLTLVLCGAVRLGPRLLRETADPRLLARLPRRLRGWLLGREDGPRRPTLVVGAGDAGETVVRLLKKDEIRGYRPVGLVDDDPRKQGMQIHGVPVLGSTTDLPRFLEDLECSVVLIAIPSARPETMRRIASLCHQAPVEVRMVPDLKSLISGERRLTDIHELDTAALLGRERVDLRIEETGSYLRDRRVLVTGAGGSIGSELCRQVLRFGPRELVLLGRGENSIFSVFNEIYRTGTPTRLHQVIGDVINKKKLVGVFERYRPEIVFHAGADKHVPLMELNPDEAVLNNILGTRNVLEVADEQGTERVICISTDKAVNPTSVMGCCKRVAELLIQTATFERTRAAAVRFGNVLGSRGSVIPLFEEQIAAGGPVTVTDRNMTRYFMTIPEAVQLVLQAGAMVGGGEIFILEMGDPVRIEDLAKNVIRLHGFEPGKEIPIQFIGLRPGEKLTEELVVDGEDLVETEHPKIRRVQSRPAGLSNGELERAVGELTELAVKMDDEGIRRCLQRLVPEFRSYPSPAVTTVEVRRD